MTSLEVRRFNACPELRERETAQSYVGRLTSFFGCKNPREFCLDFDLDLRAVHHGEPAALAALAELTGADCELLKRWTPVRLDKHFMKLNGQILHTRVNPRHKVSVCPECARSDIAAHPALNWDQAVYSRAEWSLGVVDCCATHKVRLVRQVGPPLDATRIDVGYEAAAIVEKLSQIEVEPAEPDGFQLYVLDRVLGLGEGRHSELLDPMSLVSAAQLCLAAGFDVLKRSGRATANDRERRAAGYELFRHDAAWFENCFIAQRNGRKISQMLSHMFPHLTEYLRQHRVDDPGRDLFVDALTDVAFRNLPYAAGVEIFGRVCPRRYLHNWPSAMAAYGLGRHHLLAFVDGTPEICAYIGERKQDNLIIADVADRIVKGIGPLINASEVARKIGRKPQLAIKDVDMLVEAGVFRVAEGTGRTRSKAYFSERHVDKTINGILSRCTRLTEEIEGMVTPHFASSYLGIPYQVLWRLIGSGPLPTIGHFPGQTLFKGLRVDLASGLSLVSGLDDPMLTKQVTKLLGVDRNILRLLVEAEWIEAFRPKPQYQSRLQYVFRRIAIEDFHAKYVSLRDTRRHLKKSKHQILASGLAPAINITSTLPAPAGAIFFLRSDVF